MNADRDTFRRDTLRALGAAGEILDALIAYTENPFDTNRLAGLPLPDELHVPVWEEYARTAASTGVFEALSDRIVQLRFPVREGISQTEAYRAATRRGVPPPPDSPGLVLERPDTLTLAIEQTPAGRIPVLTAGCRADFVALVRACTARNEPEAVADSMGACIVTGLNNWDRVARHRRAVEAARGTPLEAAEWAAELAALAPRKAQYQDRFIILSSEPYSAVPADEVGLDEAAWRDRSIVIRRAHECAHYFTLRAFGVMRNHLLDELLADFAGLTAAFGRYDGRLALRVLGLDRWPDYRPDGRFRLYLGSPPLPAAAIDPLRRLVASAVSRIESALAGRPLDDPPERARALVALAGLTLEELAAEDLPARLADRLARIPALA